jgi:predicted dithiol-disulfide oxidoreductase (DUF899 family)
MTRTHDVRFPGESAQYRQMRDKLLASELELHAQVLAVAELRRQLPPGGEARDYVFEEGGTDLSDRETARPVRLAELFSPRQNTLILYSAMFGPQMQQPCPMCTSFLDGLNGNAQHIRQRASLAVVAQSPLARIREVARQRGWRNLRMLSGAGNTYNRDYHGEDADGSQQPMLTVFVRRDGKIHHFYSSEALFVPEPDREPCHLDLMWPLWNVLDLTPEGRGEDWHPRLSYEA